MKKTCLILALCLAVAPARSQSQDMTAFLEGLCAGVILGISTGVVIVVAYRCWTKPKELTQYPESRPDWTLPPEFPPMTNTPPATNVVKMLLNSGDAISLYDISDLNIMDRNSGCLFTNVFATKVQTSEDGMSWTTLYRLHGWVSGQGRLVVASSDDWTAIATNYIFGSTNTLNLPATVGDKRFFRLSAP